MSKRNLVDNFEILNGPDLKMMFSRPVISEDGWLESYLFTIVGKGIDASISVVNPPYGHSPYGLFEEMNNEWSGWKESKNWGAMEGEFNLRATYKSTGHILLSAEIEKSNSWSATSNIDIEAGELEYLARRAKSFFKC